MSYINLRLTIMVAAGVVLPVCFMSQGLAAGPGVHGRVLGHDEQGQLLGIVAGAEIEFLNGSHAKVASAVADLNGYYRAELPPGEYTYRIHADGYRTEDAGRGIRLENSQGFAIFNLALTRGVDSPDRKPPVLPIINAGKLRGRVLEELPTGKSAIGNARIAFRRSGTSELKIVYSRSSSDGEKLRGDYEIVLPAGTWDAAVAAEGFDVFRDAVPVSIEVGKDSERDFILKRRVQSESRGQGVRGAVTLVDAARAEAHPLVKLRIFPREGGSGVPITVQDNGEFSGEVPPGQYRLVANAEGFPETASRPIYVFPGRYSTVNMSLRSHRVPHPEITLEVLVMGKSAARESAYPLPGAMVSIHPEGADTPATDAESDATGHVVFMPEKAGRYRVSAHAEGFGSATRDVNVLIGERQTVSLELNADDKTVGRFTIDVTVTDAISKQPVSGAKILVRHSEDKIARSARSTTDSVGRTVISVSRSGDYTLLAQAVGYKPGGSKLNVVSNQQNYRVGVSMLPTQPDVQLEPQQSDEQKPPGAEVEATAPFRISGFVSYRDAEGNLRGVNGARLIWERINPAHPPMTRFAISGENGKYEINVQKGLHQVRVEPPLGFGMLQEQVQITQDGQEKYFVVVRSNLKPPGSVENLINVTGVVVTSAFGRDMPVKNAEIFFTRLAGVSSVRTTGSGDFQISLPQDSYRLTARAGGFETLESQVRVIDGLQPLRLELKRRANQKPDFRLNLTVVQNTGRLGHGLSRSIEAAEISIVDSEKHEIHGVTNRIGQYSVRLTPGVYTVRVAKPGYRPESKQVILSAADLNEQIVLAGNELQQSAPQLSLTIRVTEHQEVAPTAKALPVQHFINGAALTVIRGSQVVAAGTTSGQGQLTIKLPNGDYSIKASAPGFASAGKTVSLRTQDSSVTLELTKRLPLETGHIRRFPERLDPNEIKNSDSKGMTLINGAKRLQGVYVVEYRLKEGSPWLEFGRYLSPEEAQRSLFAAVSQRRIPRTATTRIEVKASK